MSSLHNDLDGWASKSRLQGRNTIEITNDTAHEIAELLREHQLIRDAMFKPQSATNSYEGRGTEVGMSEERVRSVKALLDVYAPDTFDLEMAATVTSRAINGV